MRIWGFWDPFGNPAVTARLESIDPYLRGNVDFAIDTGSPHTVLSQDDAKKLMLRYDRLEKYPKEIRIAGIRTKLYIIPEVTLTFRVDNAKRPFKHLFAQILVFPPPKEVKMGERWYLPSILGRDFLDSYTLTIVKGEEIVITDEDVLSSSGPLV